MGRTIVKTKLRHCLLYSIPSRGSWSTRVKRPIHRNRPPPVTSPRERVGAKKKVSLRQQNVNSAVWSGAAPAPTITKIYDAPGQIWGGLAGDGNNLYFTTLAKNSGSTYSKVVSLTAAGAERWTPWDNGTPLAAGNMRMTPTISPDGTRLYVGADHGKVYCLDTTVSPPQRLIWQFPPQPSTQCQQVRSATAYDTIAPVPCVWRRDRDHNLHTVD